MNWFGGVHKSWRGKNFAPFCTLDIDNHSRPLTSPHPLTCLCERLRLCKTLFVFLTNRRKEKRILLTDLTIECNRRVILFYNTRSRGSKTIYNNALLCRLIVWATFMRVRWLINAGSHCWRLKIAFTIRRVLMAAKEISELPPGGSLCLRVHVTKVGALNLHLNCIFERSTSLFGWLDGGVKGARLEINFFRDVLAAEWTRLCYCTTN